MNPEPADPRMTQAVATAVMQIASASMFRNRHSCYRVLFDIGARFGPEGLFTLCWGLSGLILVSHGEVPRDDRECEVTIHEVTRNGVTVPAADDPEAALFAAASLFVTAVGNNDHVTSDLLFRRYMQDEDPGILRALLNMSGDALRSLITESMGEEKMAEFLASPEPDVEQILREGNAVFPNLHRSTGA